MIEDKRIEWIDALKGFGIFIVTFGHLSPWLPIETHIYSFHMCLFFFISGYLFKCKTSLNEYVLKKLRNILVPFIVWDILATLFALISGENVKTTILAFFIADGHLCWNAPIWFLLILFIIECIYAIIMHFNNSLRISLIVLIISVALWIVWYECGAVNFSLKLNLVPLALLFYALGDFIKKLCANMDANTGIMRLIFALVLSGAISLIFGTILNIRISYTGGTFGNIYYCILASISGTLFYYLLFKNIPALSRIKVLNVMGRNSMIIMCTQYCFFKTYDYWSQKLYKVSIWHERSTIKAFIVASITIFIIIMCASAFKKLFKDNRKILGFGKIIGIQ